MRLHTLLIYILFTFTALVTASAQKVTIKGTVTDYKDAPIEVAGVHIEGQAAGTFTDLKGRYIFTCNSSDSLVVVYSMLGYQTRKKVLRNPTDTVTLNVKLPVSDNTLEGVEIVDEQRQMGGTAQIKTPGKMRLMPDASGNGVESIIATQAGVSSHNEMSSQYNVRGGNFDENSVYVNGIEIYRPLLIRAGQQEGLSFLNPDMVGSIAFSTGGFEAKYGDKMASVLDISYRKPREFESSVAASLLGASAYVGAGNSKISFSNSLRYKTNSYLLGSLDTKGEYDPNFLDYQAFLDWRITPHLNASFIGNISRNRYNFTPSDRTTTFGTMEDVKEFKVYFGGWEHDLFRTTFGSASLNYSPNEYNQVSLITSTFSTREEETFDIMGQYWIDDVNSEENIAVGSYMQHARNYLDADVQTVALRGMHFIKSHDLQWGVEWKGEHIKENQREWEMRDSAGYNLPHGSENLEMIYSLRSNTSTSSNRVSAYLQDTYKFNSTLGTMSLNVGARISYWDWNKECIVSPRASLGLIPKFNENLTLRFATGIYYQAPFYREFRDTINSGGIATVQLNKNIKSPRSTHFVLGSDYLFKMAGRPFKFTAEAYYKKLDNIIPYNVDNVRIVYYGENCAKGYATGIDLKLFGEFVPGTDSWLTFSLMETKEKINNGEWLPRPTDQKFNMSIYFTDYFPGTDKWKMNLKGVYADGLPFGPPYSGREKHIFRAPAYKRVDIGMSYRLLDNEDKRMRNGIYRYIKNIWLGADALNLLDINNVNSYYWVSDVYNQSYAVPNYLTSRQLNVKILVEM
ncbi:MAG: carboxypeptidase-like regulatory domain-containing protein [Bacteroidaceae bacterium]|nr:carboxypeptidase-like regulatory domain-containing protein [Bacteroidaceae bacterium]